MGSHSPDRLEPVSFGSPRFKSIELSGLLVTHAIFTPQSQLCAHVHDRTCVATTLQGRFASEMRGRSYWSDPSSVLTEPAGERHANEFGTIGARVLIIQPDAARRDVFRPCHEFLDSINHFRDPRIGALAHRISLEIESPDPVTPLVVEALAQELLATAARGLSFSRDSSPPAWLLRVRDRLNDGFTEALTLDDLATTAGVHPAHLAKTFRRHHGCSVGAYQRELRLEWAAHQLADGDEPLATIAAAAGFSDQSHFTRTFRSRFGCTPATFRARARPKMA